MVHRVMPTGKLGDQGEYAVTCVTSEVLEHV